ncbi:MAG: hypothetical protein ACJ77A_10445 [Actinomycetota bacterium]
MAAGRDIRGGVHTGTEYNIYVSVGDLQDTGQVVDAIQWVKQRLREGDSGTAQPESAEPDANVMPMQTFQAQAADPYQGGENWLPELQQVAAQHGSSWVPPQTQGLGGIDLTGVWMPPGGTGEVDYVRQAGPYLNMITGIGAMQTGYSEGLFDPTSGVVRLAGRYANGVPLEAQLQLFPNWTVQGWVAGMGPFGPVTTPVFLMKVA